MRADRETLFLNLYLWTGNRRSPWLKQELEPNPVSGVDLTRFDLAAASLILNLIV
ncbi:hypothetical protein [Nodularia chucula]|uniref:hypothetical protein n=1 Tax=Nodularia chucula TaxID=3093667 RepID=UPI0039C5E456